METQPLGTKKVIDCPYGWVFGITLLGFTVDGYPEINRNKYMNCKFLPNHQGLTL